MSKEVDHFTVDFHVVLLTWLSLFLYRQTSEVWWGSRPLQWSRYHSKASHTNFLVSQCIFKHKHKRHDILKSMYLFLKKAVHYVISTPFISESEWMRPERRAFPKPPHEWIWKGTLRSSTAAACFRIMWYVATFFKNHIRNKMKCIKN